MATQPEAAKVIVQARIDKDAIDYIDKHGPTMRPPASRSALINLAVLELVEKLKRERRK